ncbi:MAG: hypothetical protein ACYDCL_12805 [Myxococcales bacterium]
MDVAAPRPRRLDWELCLGAAAVCAFGLPSLAFPFGPDQGQQAAIGRLIAEGRVLYRDIWDNRSPLLYDMAAAGWAAGLRGMAGLRIADLLYQMATAAALGALTFRLCRRRWVALLATALYGYTYYGLGDYSHTCEPDGRLALFVACALLWLLSGPSRLKAAAAGAALGLAFLTKYPALAAVLPIGLATAAAPPGVRLRQAAWVAAGFAAVQLALLGTLVASGALQPFFIDTFEFNAGYRLLGAEIPGVWPAARELLAIALSHREVLAPLLLLALVPARPPLALLWAWALAGLAMVLGQGKFYAYHFYPLLAPLAALSAVAVVLLLERFREPVPRRRKALWGLALAISVAAGGRTALAWGRSATASLATVGDEAARDRYLARHRTPDGFSVADCLEVARFVDSAARPGDHLFVFGFDPILYALSRLPPASRFVSNPPLTAPYRWGGYDRQFAADLAAHPPAFVVVAEQDRAPYFAGSALTSAERLGEQPALVVRLRSMRLALQTPTLWVYALPDRLAGAVP